jgi:hypothetical protein
MVWPGRAILEAVAGPYAFEAASYRDLMFLAEIEHSPLGDAQFTRDGPDGSVVAPVLGSDNVAQGRRVDHWILSDVISTARLPYSYPLYNLGVSEDETYAAGGILVHNCRSVRVPSVDGTVIGQRPANPVAQQDLLDEFTSKKGLRQVKDRSRLPRGTKGEFDKFKRSQLRARVGPTPATTTFEPWLKGQTVALQDDVLGPTRAKLFRDGKLEIKKFVDQRTGKLYRLDDLMQREPQAFETP